MGEVRTVYDISCSKCPETLTFAVRVLLKFDACRSALGVVRVVLVVPGVYCARGGPTCGFAAPRYVYPVSYSRSAGTKGESGPDGLEHVRR